MEEKINTEDKNSDSSKLEDLFADKIPQCYKIILYIGISTFLLTEIISLLMFLIKSDNKILFSFDYRVETEKATLFQPLIINKYLMFTFIVLFTTITFTALSQEILYRRENFYNKLGSNSLLKLGIVLNLISVFHILSIISTDIFFVYLMLSFLFFALILLGFLYHKIVRKSFNSLKEVITYRAIVAYLVSLYFYIVCSMIVKCVRQNNSGIVTFIIIFNSLYGLASLYLISIKKDSFYAIFSIILESGGLLEALLINTNNKAPDDIVFHHKHQVVICYLVIILLMILAVLYNFFRTRSSESFGFTNNEIMEQLLASKKENNKVNADSEDEINA